MIDYGRASHIGSRKIIDTANGVLLKARRCAPAEAFEDLATALHDTQPSAILTAGEGRP